MNKEEIEKLEYWADKAAQAISLTCSEEMAEEIVPNLEKMSEALHALAESNEKLVEVLKLVVNEDIHPDVALNRAEEALADRAERMKELAGE